MVQTRYEFARALVLDAGQWLSDEISNFSEIPAIDKTSHQDIVTKYDTAVEELVTDKIRTAYPDDLVVGEESFNGDQPDSPNVWYLDPIDGTTNFACQKRNYAISLAFYKNGSPEFGIVLDIAQNNLYHACVGAGAFLNDQKIFSRKIQTEIQNCIVSSPMVIQTFLHLHKKQKSLAALAEDVRAVRSLGCVALELCSLAEGILDIFITVNSYPWDHNAARIILSEAGGVLLDFEGRPVSAQYAGSIIACGSMEVMNTVVNNYLK